MDLKFSNHQILACSEGKVAGSVARELITGKFADNLPRTHRRLSESISIFVIMFLFDSHKIGLRVIFHQFFEKFSHNSPKISRHPRGGYTVSSY